MNIIYDLLAINKTYIYIGCALIGLAAVIGVIICIMGISAHRKSLREGKAGSAQPEPAEEGTPVEAQAAQPESEPEPEPEP